MKNSSGFTLVELMFVLLVVSVISLLLLPSMYKTIKRLEVKHFFEIFDSDIVYLQNQSLTTNENLRILPMQNKYTLLKNDYEIALRNYPYDLKQLNSNVSRIRFSNSGSIYNPDTYLFMDDEHIYKIVFPFGKGRHYVEEIK